MLVKWAFQFYLVVLTCKPAGTTPKKQQRKVPLVPRQMESTILHLSEAARQKLDGLMMEGDLLEVSLDETQHIWRILQACMPTHMDKILCFGVSVLQWHGAGGTECQYGKGKEFGKIFALVAGP